MPLKASSETRAAAREALKPFDEFRAAAAHRDGQKDDDGAVTPDAEVPDVPDTPT